MRFITECEICGNKATRKAKIESAVLSVCNECVKLGKEIIKIKPKPKKPATLPEELNLIIKDNFSFLIRQNREKKQLTQEQLASSIKEKASIIKRMEDGWEPPLSVIKKLERFFDIKLMGEISEEKITKKEEKEELTIGDVIKVKE